MSDEFNSNSCSPSDCASCTAGCSNKVDEAHHTITLTMDDDTEVECAVLTIFPVDSTEYIALLPLDVVPLYLVEVSAFDAPDFINTLVGLCPCR